MGFQKLVSPSLKELFMENIEAMILSGELKVGDKLPPERQLAESTGVSRAVVNAGIVELSQRGFLEIRPRVGTFVTDYRRSGNMETLKSIISYTSGRLRNDEIRSILEVRDALDKLTVSCIIPYASDADMEILGEKVEAIGCARTAEEAAEAAFAFQHELAMLSGNTLVPLIFRSFYSTVTVLWKRYCALYGIDDLYRNNRILYQYIQDRDLDGALQWVEHCTCSTISGNHQIYY